MTQENRDTQSKGPHTMQPGPELDALVSEKVMGWSNHQQQWIPRGAELVPWRPSTEIDAAWEVVRKLQRDGHLVVLSCPHSGNLHSVLVIRDLGARTWGPRQVFDELSREVQLQRILARDRSLPLGVAFHDPIVVCEKTLEHAICCAALEASA